MLGEKYDNENALMEVVPGAGGQEASLFAEEVFNFYINYCQDQGCDIEIVEETKNTLNKSSKAVTSSGITKVKRASERFLIKFLLLGCSQNIF